jgi:uncharacterized protein (TIGR02996 family)
MTDQETLLAAIVRDPADALAWLALADWLEDDGQQPRAELLRLTRTLLTLDRMEGKRPELEARQWALLASGVRPCVPERALEHGMRLVLVPPGKFWMGSPAEEKDRDTNEHFSQVTVARAFWIGATPVTQAQYEAVMGRNPSHHRTVPLHDTSSFPVEALDWADALEFCGRVGARLPAEWEWEYACRAGTAGPHYTGPVDDDPTEFHAGAKEWPSAVGRYPPNAFGLYDTLGNVWEMAGDFPEGFEQETSAVRGGCYQDAGGVGRAAKRLTGEEDYESVAPGKDLGFRVVMEWKP